MCRSHPRTTNYGQRPHLNFTACRSAHLKPWLRSFDVKFHVAFEEALSCPCLILFFSWFLLLHFLILFCRLSHYLNLKMCFPTPSKMTLSKRNAFRQLKASILAQESLIVILMTRSPIKKIQLNFHLGILT